MNQQDIEKAIYKVNKGISDKRSLGEKREKLDILIKDPKVIEYLDLLDEINRIERNVESYRSVVDGKLYDSLDERIVRAFRFGSGKDCQHDFWIYRHSYYENYADWCHRWCEEGVHREYSENVDSSRLKFLHNKYICLECEKEIEVVDWKKFEEENFVFKKYGHVNSDYYRDEYFKLLYKGYSLSEIEEFLTKMFIKKEEGQVLGKRKVRIKLADK